MVTSAMLVTRVEKPVRISCTDLRDVTVGSEPLQGRRAQLTNTFPQPAAVVARQGTRGYPAVALKGYRQDALRVLRRDRGAE